MKILAIKSLNINSLKGITEINFAELTKDSSLFAITGPTGSGKSTILDIISCALYGRTARLKNPNDLMSRHSGEAYCEVEFDIKGKIYRSSWSQKRARKKHDGTFQTAKMELVDLEEDKILPLKSREVPKKIEELSGLDFGRFTQSMLLAQGGFDAFLKADEKDRSILLEKITATQIYAEISKAIFEKYKNYQQEIDSDKKILDSIDLIDVVVVEEKQTQLANNIVQKKETDLELKELLVTLNWMQTLSELTDENNKYEDEFKNITNLKDEHKNSFKKLLLDTKALNVSATFTSYTQLQENIIIDKKLLTKYSEEVILFNEEIKDKYDEYSAIKKEFEEASTKFEVESKNLKKAREIQVQEKEIKLNLTKEENLLKDKREYLIEITDIENTIIKEYNRIEKQLNNKKAYLLSNSKDEKLIEVIGIIEQNLREYKKEKNILIDNKSKLKISENIFLTKEINYNLQKEKVDKLSSICNEIKLEYTKLELSSTNDFKIEKDTQQSLEDTKTLSRTLENYTQVIQTIDKEFEEYEKNNILLNGTIETIKVSEQSVDILKKHILTLREKYETEQLLKKYEEDRLNLVDGEPCLLCGSLNHPFVNSINVIHIDATKDEISIQIEELEKQEKNLKDLELYIGIIQTKQEASKSKTQKLEQEIEIIKNIFNKYSFELMSNSAIILKEEEEKFIEKLDVLNKHRIKKDELLKCIDKANKDFQLEEKSLNEIKNILEKLSIEKEQLFLSIKSNQVKIDDFIKTLKNYMKSFDIKLDLETIDIQYKELVDRKELYVKIVESLKLLDIELNKCNINKKENETKVNTSTKEIEIADVHLKELNSKLNELSSTRIEILNVVDLDIYEQEIITKYKALQDKEQFCKNTLNELKIKSEERLANKKSLNTKIILDEKKLNVVKIELDELYEQNNFKDSDEFKDAILDKKERDKLTSLCSEIDDKYKQVQTLKIQITKKLEEHKKVFLSDRPIDELKNLQALLEQKINALQESIGSDKKELELNQENNDKFQERIISLDRKKESFKVWVKLNELIGSADGTKFKKFAQGITLDQLINLANKHLTILSSRYILARNQDKLLDLEIIDAYQGNVVRPVSTLSGGESFIVSLALALGLSELASQKISIDSLFLDEGFGTLDEESLETALNALNLLQSGGKMVGVISHVEALKDRIPLQIKVIPNGDGTSFIDI